MLKPGEKLSHYNIISSIGAGGMGEVYLAEDTRLERQIALKILLPDIAKDEDRVRRFVQEAKAASALNHPNILTVYEIGEFEDSRYIATELIKGETLRDRMHGETLTLRETLDVAMQVAAALNAAHEAGIVHRDIKPENIMLRDDGLAKVLDFGLAKLTEKQPDATSSEDATRALVNTRPGMVMGTVAYMSPEQARGKQVDARSDIWSLGIVMYEMLAKETPFAGETANDSIAGILTKDPPPLNENTPAELQRIIRKSLQKKADERYQTVKDLLLDVKHLKRELEFSEELERSHMPSFARASNVAAGQTDENATALLGVPSSDGSSAGSTMPPKGGTQNMSSAEYLVSEIKNHKKSVAAIVAILVVTLLGGGYWLWASRSIGSGQINSIAVLPFENRSGNADSDYLSDGISDSLIFRLSQLPNLKVSPVSSVMRYKGKDFDTQKIAAELGVQAVMSGRMTQRGDNLGISVELIDVANNKIIWGEQYDRKMSDLLATQREIATAIVQKLQLKLAGTDTTGITKKYTDNNEAYQLYLKGRFHFASRTKDGILKSIDYYQQAIKLDPNFARAYVAMAESYSTAPSYPYMSPAEANPQAKAAAEKALELDPDLPEAHTVAGLIAATYDWDYPKAEHEFKRSLELDPNIAVTHYRYAWVYLSPLGRHDEAISEMKRAMELEPLSIMQGANFAGVLMYARRFDDALEQAKKTYELDPTHIGTLSWLGHTYNAKGMYAESVAIMEKASQPNNTFYAQMGYSYAKLSRRSDAEAVINKWKEAEKTTYVMSYWVAVTYAALGEKDAAFTELEKAYQAHDWFLQRIKVDPFMDPLRDDPRYKDLLKRLNLPE